jgi:BioD-like phosphotransacetylase family protein
MVNLTPDEYAEYKKFLEDKKKKVVQVSPEEEDYNGDSIPDTSNIREIRYIVNDLDTQQNLKEFVLHLRKLIKRGVSE